MNQHYSNQSFFTPPSNIASMPNSEINWAQLAQRWIHTHQQQQPQAYPYPPQQMPNVTPIPFQQPRPNYPMEPPIAGGFFSQPPMMGAPIRPLNQQQWPRPWIPPPNMGYPPQHFQKTAYQAASSSFTDNYTANIQGNASKPEEEEEYQAHYDPSLEQDEFAESSEQKIQNSDVANAIPEGAMSHWMADPIWAAAAGVYPSSYIPIIDTQMRKKLPAWILEGLEKAEKEKQKKMEKDEKEKRQKEREEQLRKKREEKGLGKFDSDSEDDEGDKEANESPERKSTTYARHFHESVKDEGEEMPFDERSEDERKEEAVLLMRRLMTSVLLDATNRVFERIVEESIAKAKLEAQPKILAQSSALAALFSFDDDEDEDDSGNDDNNVAIISPKKEKSENDGLNAPPIQKDKPKGLNSTDTTGVFKVPLAPQPKSSQEPRKMKPKAPEQQQENLIMRDLIGRAESDGHGRDQPQEQEHESDKKRGNDKVKRHEHDRDEKKQDRDRGRDDNLPEKYRSAYNGNEKVREREKDREHEKDRERRKEKDRYESRDERERSKKNGHSDRERRRRSRSRSRSPRSSRRRSSSYRDRSRSPRR